MEERFLPNWEAWISNEEDLPLEWRKGIYRGMVERLREKNPKLRGLSVELIMGLMDTESDFSPGAKSKSGALGLLQVKPETGEWIRQKLGEEGGGDLADPMENILTGMLYLGYLKDRFGSVDKAVQAYNVGPGAFERGKRNLGYLKSVKKDMKGF